MVHHHLRSSTASKGEKVAMRKDRPWMQLHEREDDDDDEDDEDEDDEDDEDATWRKC